MDSPKTVLPVIKPGDRVRYAGTSHEPFMFPENDGKPEDWGNPLELVEVAHYAPPDVPMIALPMDEADYFSEDLIDPLFQRANEKLASFGWRGLASRQQVVAVLRALVELQSK